MAKKTVKAVAEPAAKRKRRKVALNPRHTYAVSSASKGLKMRQKKFLDLLSQNTNVTKSCEMAALNRIHAYDLRDRDEKFRVAWDRAIETGTEALIDEATRRATEGVDDDVYGKDDDGNYIIIGTKNKRSDRLLEFMLKARKKDMFRDRSQIDHQGDIDVQVGVSKAVLELIHRTTHGLNKKEN